MKIDNNYPKSLKDVWEWKEKVYNENKNAPERIKILNEKTRLIAEKFGLKIISR